MFQKMKAKAKHLALLASVGVGNAMAALPTEVTTDMGAAKTDAKELAILGLLIVIAIAAIKYLRSAK